jgi:hypothetical protein
VIKCRGIVDLCYRPYPHLFHAISLFMCLHVLATMFCSIESIVIEGLLRFDVTNWTRHSKSAMFEVDVETTYLNFRHLVKRILLKPKSMSSPYIVYLNPTISLPGKK